MSRANNEYREDEFVAARKLMIRQDLIGRGIQSTSVLAALEQTPREQFVLDADGHLAYADCALPISCGQTISQPYMVALMTDLLDLSGEEHVLEIGTGSGYQTAILAQLAHDVVTFERHTVLSRQAESRLKRLGLNNVVFVVGDGSHLKAHFIVYVLMHVETLERLAGLAIVVKADTEQLRCYFLWIHVGQHDAGIIAAKF